VKNGPVRWRSRRSLPTIGLQQATTRSRELKDQRPNKNLTPRRNPRAAISRVHGCLRLLVPDFAGRGDLWFCVELYGESKHHAFPIVYQYLLMISSPSFPCLVLI
jgi:hypothetical protein